MKATLAIAAAILVGGTAVSAQDAPQVRTTQHQDPFMNPPPPETVYATNHHLGFSWRSSVITWLGGVPIVDERDLRSSERERWWGRPVPLLPPDVLKGTDR